MELLVAAVLATLLAVWGSQALVNRVSDASAESAAAWMAAVHRGVYGYLERHGASLRQALSAGRLADMDYADWAAPTVSELKSDGLLSAGFPTSAKTIGGAHVRILREGECPGDLCRLGAIVYSHDPLLRRSGVVDEHMMARWLMASGGQGGTVHPARPGLLQGPLFQYPNPLPGGPVLPAGTVALALSNEALSDFLRVGDRRNPDFQGGMTVHGSIHTDGDLIADGGIILNSTSSWQSPCSPNGAITRDSVSGLLVCTYGSWQQAARSPGGYSTNSRYGCATPSGRGTYNPVTGACSCPPGYSSVLISEGSTDVTNRGITQGFLCVN